MNKVIFIRHGESVANLENIYGSQTMTPLTDKGKEQARNAALLLRDKNIKKVISSDLKRAVQTAEEVKHMLRLNDLETEQWVDLREVDCGEFTGGQKPEGMSVIERAVLSEEGEKQEDVAKRVFNVLEKIKNLEVDGDILIVGHNSFTSSIFCLMEDPENIEGLVEYRKRWKMGNSEVREITM